MTDCGIWHVRKLPDGQHPLIKLTKLTSAAMARPHTSCLKKANHTPPR